jgi:hypothetical protein
MVMSINDHDAPAGSGRGASGRSSPFLISSAHISAGGGGADASAKFRRACSGVCDPITTDATAGWAAAKASAAAGNETPWRAQTVAIARARAMIASGASP